jgi:hypothetical protein
LFKKHVQDLLALRRWDPALQRWLPTKEKTDSTLTVIKPLTGSEYTVWPIMHSYLTKKKLKSIKGEEVG